ncbi:MAG: hypothetical protein KDD22_01750 [Bdellovibrionales bacterium]|nr:hypothetical protein [Bdellovibrionales bacterium]
MKHSQLSLPQNSFFDQIQEFLKQSPGLKSLEEDSNQTIRIHQETDGKVIRIDCIEIDEVISRVDNEGQAFLQVNFTSGHKILITDTLVGFKPAESQGLDMSKLPKVVTTPDLISVVEALEEAMSSSKTSKEEVDILRQVFDSVLKVAEGVGFDLTSEKVWLQHLVSNPQKASA